MPTPWLRTAQAAAHIGCSPATLRRLIRDGKVRSGLHYMQGHVGANSPITWNIEALEKRLGELTPMPASSKPAASTTTTEND
jgi:hypothetical protein